MRVQRKRFREEILETTLNSVHATAINNHTVYISLCKLYPHESFIDYQLRIAETVSEWEKNNKNSGNIVMTCWGKVLLSIFISHRSINIWQIDCVFGACCLLGSKLPATILSHLLFRILIFNDAYLNLWHLEVQRVTCNRQLYTHSHIKIQATFPHSLLKYIFSLIIRALK